MEKVKVGVVGFGTIGERVADGVAAQDDMELLGVCDIEPTLPVRALVASGKGYPIYCAIPDKVEEMEAAGIPIAGTLDDLLGKVDMVCDATTPGVGMKNKAIYQKHKVRATFQGGEKNEVAEIIFNTMGNYEQALGKDYIKILSCNTTGIVRATATLDEAFGVEKMVALIVRRAADPSEIHKGPIDAAIPQSIPSHQAEDFMSVLPHIEAVTVVVTVPTTHGHVNSMHVVTSREVSKAEVIEAFKSNKRIKLFKLADGFLSNTHIFDYLRDLGRPRADMYEVGVWEDTIYVKGNDVFWVQNIPQEAIVIPENIDAVRAAMRMQASSKEAFERTNRNLDMV
jgi:glyceraldehyde-3-phosphate dehydrogenase (NAD(P))